MRHALVALTLTLALASCRPPPAAEPLLPETRAAVQLTLPRLGGGTLSLEAQRGRPVVLSLFTTWCFRCQAEAPFFQRLHERFAARGLLVVGIALNAGGTRPAELVRLYVEETGFRFPVLIAAPDDLELVGGLGRTPEIPRTLLLDPEGRILLDQVGETRFAALEAAVLRVLGEASTRRAPGSAPTR